MVRPRETQVFSMMELNFTQMTENKLATKKIARFYIQDNVTKELHSRANTCNDEYDLNKI